MNKTQFIDIINRIVESGRKQPGVTEVAVCGTLISGLDVIVRLGETNKVEFNSNNNIEIFLLKDKRKGMVSINDLSSNSINSAITAAIRIANYTEPDEYAGLPDRDLLAKEILDLDLDHPTIIEPNNAIALAKECEDAAFAYNKCIKNSDGVNFNTINEFNICANSNGFIGAFSETQYSASCIIIAEQKGLMQRDYDYTIARNIHDLSSMQYIGESAASKAIARLGASKIKTCNVPILFTPRIAATLWEFMISAISGNNLYRKRSFLLDSINTKILPDFIQISENPHIPRALGSAPFDAEGVATHAKSIIKNGVLQTYLLNSYSARRLNMRSSGNAGGVHNFCVTTHKAENYDQLIQKMDKGLIVTELLGHGINIVTGDYSQGAVGFWVENGKILKPVEEITIAGNLKHIFNNIIAMGNDIEQQSNIITGSILLEQMMVAGN